MMSVGVPGSKYLVPVALEYLERINLYGS
jgi:hypothetical protein